MSNLEAAKVYEDVIEGVINEVRQDFENAGIDEQTLQDLRRIWQSKLSEFRVAKFIWDPEIVNEGYNNINGGMVSGANILDQQNVPAEIILKDDSQTLLPIADEEIEANIAISKSSGKSGYSKQEIELTMKDPSGEIAEQLKLQAKQAKKSALLETDEINSDLDDSDDDYVNFPTEEEGNDVNIMLCLYEKVLRVKNKWKCNLKDGLATINNRDYAFQKSQGESEW